MTSKLSRKTQDKRLHSLTNFITRDVMRLIKGMTTIIYTRQVNRDEFILDLETKSNELLEMRPGSFPLRIDKSTLTDEYIEHVDTDLSITVEIDRNSDRFNVSASDKPLLGISDIGMHILVELPENLRDSDMKILRDEISNSVRHELEHISQGHKSDNPFSVYGRGREYYTSIHGPSDVDGDFAKYLLDSSEIPAFVRGHSHNSKSRSDLERRIDKFLCVYREKNLINDYEKTIIFNSWAEWSKRFLKQKRFLS